MSKDKREPKEALRMSFPKVPVYKEVGNYFRMKAKDPDFQWRSYEWDKARHSPDAHLIATRRIYDRTEGALEVRREFYKNERIKLEEQWKELAEKELAFRENFIKLSSFVKTNQEKRERAVERFGEERKIRLQREKEIEVLKVKMLMMQESKKQMDRNIYEHKMYERFLDQVVVASEADFKNVNDLIGRYESLVNTKNELAERQNYNLRLLEYARAKTAKRAEENSFIILGLNNTLASMNARYKIAEHKAMHWESVVLAIKRNSFYKFLEINEVKQSCWNIYLLMCRRKGETPKLDECDFENQLIYIKKTLEELKKINEAAKVMNNKLRPSSMKADASKAT